MQQQTYTPTWQLNQTNFDEKQKNHRQKSRIFHYLLMFCLLSTGIFTASCGSLPKESAKAQSQQRTSREGNQAVPVDVAIARIERLQPQTEYTGTTTPYRTVSLRSQVEGRLLSLNSDVGDSVTKGQTIGQLDDTILSTDFRQAEAELAALQSEVARASTQISNANAEVERLRLELVQAEADANRQQQLFKEGAISEQQAQQANTKAKTAAQALRAAQERVRTEQQAEAAARGRVFAQKAVLAQTKERRSYSRLISPITGVVTEKVTEPGNLLQAGGEALKIADFSRIKVVVQVSELELNRIQIGQSVEVRLDAFPQEKLIGRVTRISPTADATARLIPVEVVIPNSNNNISSGLLARVSFATQVPQRVVISQTALQKSNRDTAAESNGTIYVLADTADKPKVMSRAVTLGEKADGKVEILSGLQPGDRYVVRSGRPLKDGDAVRLSILSEKSGS
ncbi:efflux transporter periplasmic adaptor subunit [Nostoc sp. CENA543]|uniref:efflux RND transporter periplasmic adaptor subunit n=1 Tax=Nostoc sp. CENA543 TaxID=1869241 RepID=UPI000CA0E5A4|nr:efflux RND transporter periplasmic adaptor subunit [Nostoc sp. CENA543]AUT03642.1 efflux transporter periplasmic adaptor subunit [Nostoc sp. CENA543]